jgi:hypothetical protein
VHSLYVVLKFTENLQLEKPPAVYIIDMIPLITLKIKLMNIFAFISLTLFLCVNAFAGGPTIEMERVSIEKIRFVEGGANAGTVVLRVSGQVKIFAPLADEDGKRSSSAHWVSLWMDDGEIRFRPTIKHDATKSYRERIMKLEGTTQKFQMWGTTSVLHGAEVTQIIATSVGLLMPTENEELSEHPKPPTNNKE